MKSKTFFLLTVLLVSISGIKAEPNHVPILDRKVTIVYTNETIENILEAISEQAGFKFSYSPDELHVDKKISVDFQNKSVGYVLDEIFDVPMNYKVNSNYLIIQKNNSSGATISYDPEEKDQKDNNMLVEQLHEKTVESELSDTLAPDKARFESEVFANPDSDDTFDRPFHMDTVTHPASAKEQDEPVAKDEPEAEELVMPSDDGLFEFSEPDTLVKNFQISLFPGLGTDGASTKDNVYNFSVNIFLGSVKGIKIMEFGGIGNIVKEDAGVVQGAGVFNIVGGHYKGIQTAGAFNAVKGDVNGVQLAKGFNKAKSLNGFQSSRLFNFIEEDAKYAQFTGISNITAGHFQGIQGAGVFNMANSLNGAQVSGVFNLSGKTEGVQIAGLFNVADESPGLQAASVFNVAKNINGTQLSSVFNSADSVNGAQLSAVFNRAHYFRGVQVGLINVADSCHGVPIGLLNFIRKGYHKLEISANELLEVNMAYRGGIKPFHSILSAGIIPTDMDEPYWSVGVGLGSSIQYSDNASLELELMSKTISKGSYFAYKNSLNSIGAGIDWHVSPNFSFYTGITFNMYLADMECDHYEEHFSGFMPYTLSDNDFDETINLKTWFGLKLGFRLF